MPVVVDNDAVTAALAEHRVGAGVGTAAMLLLALGTGVGVAVVRRGAKPYQLAARRIGADIRQCVAVEDSPNGLQAAVQSGATVLAVPCDVPLALNPRWTRADSLEALTVNDLAELISR